MKFSLKANAIVVSLIMLGIFFYQLYWLDGLYRTYTQQFDQKVYDAMDFADQQELFLRIDQLKSVAHDSAVSLDIKIDEDSVGNRVYYAKKTDIMDSVITVREEDAGFNDYKDNLQTTEKLAAYIKKTLHQTNDGRSPVDMEVFDSLLTRELMRNQIEILHQVFIVYTPGDSICAIASQNVTFNDRHLKKYDFRYDLYGTHAYRLILKKPYAKILAQMAGILFTSIVIFALLDFLFIYLLKVIRKLQTEEELKTNFTNNMTHELKTPIAVSYASIDALLVAKGPVSEERRKKYLNIAKEQMAHLSGMVEQILHMSRMDNRHIGLKIEPVDLLEIVSGLTEKLRLVTNKAIEVETQFLPSPVLADKLHLTNILNNLMENGIKYSGNPTKLSITSYASGRNIAISVKDNGIGIEPKYQQKLFDKFYRVPTGNRHNVKGFGLGLFYVKEMTEMHKGSVEVKSHPGKGSIFTINIPQP